MELVQEIYQVLTDKEDTCHRTCFSLQHNGQVLDNFAELKTIEGLKEGSIIKVVEGKCLLLGTVLSYFCERYCIAHKILEEDQYPKTRNKCV